MSYRYTVLCKMPHDRRGEYSEEIDVEISYRSVTAAKRAAQEIIEEMYDPQLRPSRVINAREIQIQSIS